ncbi:MAG TPA: YIP1 family protein [Bacillota bacterium]|nr:YIP1 family protein [Bacillota bacterium]
MKKLTVIMLLLLLLFSGSKAKALEKVPYSTYTYTYEGEPIESPHAFVPGRVFDTDELGLGSMREPEDIFVDQEGSIYVADTGNNRILILDNDFETGKSISGFVYEGVEDSLSRPGGIYVTLDGDIYVADTGNARIVKFTSGLECSQIIRAPESTMLPGDFSFIPSKIVVDKASRIYCVSRGNIYGVMVLNSDGGFETFIGAQKVVPNLGERFWRMFMTREQLKRTAKIVPSNYNNIVIDEKGFLYLTSVSSETSQVIQSIQTRSTDNRYAPIKKLNPNGEDVLFRNGFFPPAGDVKIEIAPRGRIAAAEVNYGPSFIVDAALGDYGTYSLMDQKRGKVFTYDSEGNLLFVFGGAGYQPGLFQKLSSIDFDNNSLYALDGMSGKITRFSITSYGEQVLEAIRLTEERKYDASVRAFEDILLKNNNFDMAHIGIGNAMIRRGEYSKAMQYYKNANDVSSYSKAFGYYRKEIIGDFILLIPLFVGGLFFLVSAFFKYSRRYNFSYTSQEIQGRSTLQEIMYGFHVIFHPFDGFYDLKHEKRGGMKGATFFLVCAVAVMLFKEIGTGYISSGTIRQDFNPLISSAVFLGIVILWCTANWCLTSLMSGEGSYKDIYISTCYCLVPMILLVIPSTILSNFVTEQELMFVSFITAVGFIWTALLLFVAVMTTHAYTLGKNIATIIFTLVGMILIAFVMFLFVNLIGRMVTFIQNVYNEVTFRI